MKRSSFYEMPNQVDIKDSNTINTTQGITSENGTSFSTLSWGLYLHMYVLSRVVVKRAKIRVLSVEKELRSFGLRRPRRTTGGSYIRMT
ncbi:uncharacterized protein FTOL_07961 [Fusarium torulosum]|uniref:Uncharacterized protein n=1 Tax=Fusarium torulosum TaxID=33205 RepID=A0AAE8SK10_9HYPO|nr:uncharacterized protein FTOL_07961 [Fusarium torulosum]